MHFVPGIETKEDYQPGEEEIGPALLVEEAGAIDIENKEDKLPIDENKNEELEKVSPEKDEDISAPVEDEEEKIMQEEKEDTNSEEQTLPPNEQEEKTTEEHLPEGEETESERKSVERMEIKDTEKENTVEEALPESLEQENLSKGIIDTGVSETGEENDEMNKEEDGSHHEFVIAIESTGKESQEDVKDVSVPVETLESGTLVGGDSVHQDTETTTLVDKEEEKILSEVDKQTLSQETDTESNVATENKEVGVAMETDQHVDDGPEEEPKNEKPDISVITEAEVKNNDDGIPQPLGTPGEVTEVRDTNEPLESGSESSMVEKNASIEIDQVNTSNQADEGKINEVKSQMEEDDNIVDIKVNTEDVQDGESLAPTLEEQLDIQLQQRRESVKTEELQPEGMQISYNFSALNPPFHDQIFRIPFP